MTEDLGHTRSHCNGKASCMQLYILLITSTCSSSVMFILFSTVPASVHSQCPCIIRQHAAPCCRIAAGGDTRFRQNRLGAGDSFEEDDDAFEKEDFAGFDKPTRIEGEEGGGHVDPDPGDRDSVSLSDRQPHASLHLWALSNTSDTCVQYCHSTCLHLSLPLTASFLVLRIPFTLCSRCTAVLQAVFIPIVHSSPLARP